MWNEILINLGRLNIPHTCRSSWAGFIKYFTRQQRQWRTNTCSVCMHMYFSLSARNNKSVLFHFRLCIRTSINYSYLLTFNIFLMMKNIYSVPNNTRVILIRRYIYIRITPGALWLILIETRILNTCKWLIGWLIDWTFLTRTAQTNGSYMYM